MRVCVSPPDEAAEEAGGVADDAGGTGLLVLTPLQGQPVVHVALCVETRLWTHTRASAHAHTFTHAHTHAWTRTHTQTQRGTEREK